MGDGLLECFVVFTQVLLHEIECAPVASRVVHSPEFSLNGSFYAVLIKLGRAAYTGKHIFVSFAATGDAGKILIVLASPHATFLALKQVNALVDILRADNV